MDCDHCNCITVPTMCLCCTGILALLGGKVSKITSQGQWITIVKGYTAVMQYTTTSFLHCLQDDFYNENAKQLMEASDQLPQEVRNVMPTVANVGHTSHHHPNSHATKSLDQSSGSAPGGALKSREGNLLTGLIKADKEGLKAAREQDPSLPIDGPDGPQPGGEVSGGPPMRIPRKLGPLKAPEMPPMPPVMNERQQFLLVRWAQKAAGAVLGVATAGFLIFYQWLIEPAPPKSWRVKAFAAAAQVCDSLECCCFCYLIWPWPLSLLSCDDVLQSNCTCAIM